MRRTCGFEISSSPIGAASRGACVTMLSTPGGRPASSKISPQSRPPTHGDSSDGLSTTVLPNTSGAAIERAERISAAFHGAIAPTTPTGLADGHRHRAGHVGREDLADRHVRGAGRLAEQAGHEVHLEHPEPEARAGLAGQPAGDLVAARLEQVGGLQEDALPHGRRGLRPRLERRRRRVDRALARRRECRLARARRRGP